MIEYLCDGHGRGSFYQRTIAHRTEGDNNDQRTGEPKLACGDGTLHGSRNGDGESGRFFAKTFTACPDSTDLAAALVNVVVRPK